MNFFRGKRVNFYRLLLDQARKVEEGIRALVDFMKNPDSDEGEHVLRIEVEADDLRRRLLEELNQAFVTPIDREDIYALSRSVDDIMDYAKSTVEEMRMFKVKSDKHMMILSQGISEVASAIAEAIAALSDQPEQAKKHLVLAKKRENYVEHCYREALTDLFQNDNVVTILKVREIYRHLSNAADRGDEAANIIGNILVKAM